MLTIQLPNICVQRVTNGYVVQWQRKCDNGPARTISVSAVCMDKADLLEAIDHAADDIMRIGE
jgi:hypothetical protein